MNSLAIYQKELVELLDELETQTAYDTGVRRLNGGFACAELSYDDGEDVFINLTWGIQDTDGSELHQEECGISIENLMLPLTAIEKLKYVW